MKNNMKINMSEPSFRWEEAAPIGNGSFGGMVFGRVEEEIIGLNEDTFWSGKPLKDQGFDMRECIDQTRELLDEGHYFEAQKYLTKSMNHGHWTQNYLPIGNVVMDFKQTGSVNDYKRELDMENGIVKMSYEHENIKYTREYFCSKVDDVMVIHLTSSTFAGIRCFIDFTSHVKHEVKAKWDYLEIQGEAPIHVDPIYDMKETPVIYDKEEQGIRFGSVMKIYTDGYVMTNGSTLSIQNGTEATIYIACKTNFIDADTSSMDSKRDPINECEEIVRKAMDKGYDAIKKDHEEDFSSLMNRVSLDFHQDNEDDINTDTKIENMKASHKDEFDTSLVESLFQFGRYLILSGSREGSQATNLQGIWNNLLQAAWCSNYTININTEMNYWPVDVANLSECAKPLTDMVIDLSNKGHVSAEGMGCKGWTAHHNTDIWHQTVPVSGNAQYSFWPFGGPWLTLNLYEHYRFTKSKDYLKGIYPTMKGAVEFCLDWAYEEEGTLTTSPSTSPENSYNDEDGNRCAITKSATMDMSIMWELFTQFEEASKELDMEEELLVRVAEAKTKLPVIGLTEDGCILEFDRDFEPKDLGHRHVSNMLGLYPGTRIDTDKDTELLEACYKTLMKRLDNGGGHTSWSCAWFMLLAARLKNSDFASHMITKFQKHSLIKNGFSSHPPFQIDGNFGFLAGMCEMLIQSHQSYIEILPACPVKLGSGEFKGLCARGGFEVNAKWTKGTVTQVWITSKVEGPCSVKVNGKMYDLECKAGKQVEVKLEDESVITM